MSNHAAWMVHLVYRAKDIGRGYIEKYKDGIITFIIGPTFPSTLEAWDADMVEGGNDTHAHFTEFTQKLSDALRVLDVIIVNTQRRVYPPYVGEVLAPETVDGIPGLEVYSRDMYISALWAMLADIDDVFREWHDRANSLRLDSRRKGIYKDVLEMANDALAYTTFAVCQKFSVKSDGDAVLALPVFPDGTLPHASSDPSAWKTYHSDIYRNMSQFCNLWSKVDASTFKLNKGTDPSTGDDILYEFVEGPMMEGSGTPIRVEELAGATGLSRTAFKTMLGSKLRVPPAAATLPAATSDQRAAASKYPRAFAVESSPSFLELKERKVEKAKRERAAAAASAALAKKKAEQDADMAKARYGPDNILQGQDARKIADICKLCGEYHGLGHPDHDVNVSPVIKPLVDLVNANWAPPTPSGIPPPPPPPMRPLRCQNSPVRLKRWRPKL